MLIELVGVVESGGPRAAGVPSNPRKALTVPLGSNLTLRVIVLNPDGSQLQFAVNSLTWTVKKSPRDADKVFSKTGPSAPGQSCDFSMVPADTKQLTPSRYVYDVWHTDGAGLRNSVVPLSPFELEYVATLPP